MTLPFKLGSREISTLNIEGSSLRLMVVKGDEITRWGEKTIRPGLVREGLVIDTSAVAASIEELFEEQDAPKDRVVTALTGLRAIPRILKLPKIKANLLDDAIRREARKEMPLALDSLYLSWQTISESAGQREVYLMGVSCELMDSHVQTIQSAGIRPLAVDLKPLALVRAIDRSEAVVADLEPESLTIVLLIDRIPVIMRSFPFEALASSIEERVEQLILELRQTIRFYNESHQDNPLRESTAVCLTGSAMTDSNTVAMLRAGLQRSIELPKSPLNHPSGLPVASFMTNIGLALKKI